MYMGFKTAPAWFRSFMEATFADFIQTKTLEVYQEDEILLTNNVQQHGTTSI